MNKTEYINKACDVLKDGGTIIYPTDTVIGLGCDASNETAVNKIFQIKKREPGKSLIVLVSDEFMLERIVPNVPEIAWTLFDITTEPLTIIFDEADNISEKVKADDGSLGVRIIREGICHELIRQYKKPIVSTSVNFSGEIPAKHFNDINEKLRSQVAFILAISEPNASASPSKIIKIGKSNEVKVIRK